MEPSTSEHRRSRRSTLQKPKHQEKLHQEAHLIALDETVGESHHEKDTIDYFRNVFQAQNKEAITATAPKGFYQQMHLLSKIGTSRFSSVKLAGARGSDSVSSISNLTTKLVPNSYLAELRMYPPFIPAHLGPDRTWHDRYATEVRNCTHRIQTGTQLESAAARVITIVKHKSRILFLPRVVNYSMAPITAVKVQWRVSRFLRVPSFLLIYSMLSRYGTVVALIKLSSNSALCIYDNLQQAQLAVNMNSLHQSYKILILSWWYQEVVQPLPSSEIYDKLGSKWLLTVCDDVIGTKILAPTQWSYEFSGLPYDESRESETPRESILRTSRRSIKPLLKLPEIRFPSGFAGVQEGCIRLDPGESSGDDGLDPKDWRSRNASFLCDLGMRTRKASSRKESKQSR